MATSFVARASLELSLGTCLFQSLPFGLKLACTYFPLAASSCRLLDDVIF